MLFGALIVGTSGLLALGDSDDLSARLPTQVVPRRFLRYPAAIGMVLIVLGSVASLRS